MSFSNLPREVLVEVLQHIDLQQRLGMCALVNSAWRDASMAATTSITHYVGENQEGMMPWLAQYGQHVTTVELTGDNPSEAILTFLPCSQLRSLRLCDCSLQLAPNAGHPGLLHVCLGLTKLSIEQCYMLEDPASLIHLSVLTGLQELCLESLETSPGLEPPVLPSNLLSHLTQLTALDLTAGVTHASFKHLSCLTGLSELLLSDMPNTVCTAALSGLYHLRQLTRLYVCNASSLAFGSNSSIFGGIPALGQLTALQKLQLIRCEGIAPELLAAMVKLQSLELNFTSVLGGAAGLEVLLRLLPQLQQLTSLTLCRASWSCASAAAYAGLTSGSKLQQIHLQAINLPRNAWQHMFVTGRQLPSLQQLTLNNVSLVDPGRLHELRSLGNLIRTNELEQLVHYCPSLKHLGIVDSLAPGVQLTALQLPQITSLILIAAERWSPGARESLTGLEHLASLTGLEHLHLDRHLPVSVEAALHLTKLKQLAHLAFRYCRNVPPGPGLADYMLPHPTQSITFDSKAPPDCPPDVWLQLLEWCNKDSFCRR